MPAVVADLVIAEDHDDAGRRISGPLASLVVVGISNTLAISGNIRWRDGRSSVGHAAGIPTRDAGEVRAASSLKLGDADRRHTAFG